MSEPTKEPTEEKRPYHKKEEFLGIDKPTWSLALGGIGCLLGLVSASKIFGDMLKNSSLAQVQQQQPQPAPVQQQVNPQIQAMENGEPEVEEIQAPEQYMVERDPMGGSYKIPVVKRHGQGRTLTDNDISRISMEKT